jgi:hypothetical protein
VNVEAEQTKKSDVENQWVRGLITYERPGIPYIQAKYQKGSTSGPDGTPDGDEMAWQFRAGAQPLRFIFRKKLRFDPVVGLEVRHEEFSRDGRSIKIDSKPVGAFAEVWYPFHRKVIVDPLNNTSTVKSEWNLNAGFRGGYHDVVVTNPDGRSEFSAWLWDGFVGAQYKWNW